MRASLDGWALITGASSGIGAAVARRLARDGWSLVLVGRNEERLRDVADDCRSLGAGDVRSLMLDIRNREHFAEAVRITEAEAPIALYVACAGILDGRHAGEIVETATAARAVIDTNLTAAIGGAYAVLPGMLGRSRGAIVFVASLAAFVPLSDAPTYSATKAGLLAFGLGLRDALADRGIRVCVACPGYVETAMTARHRGSHLGKIDAEEAAERILDGLWKNRGVTAFPKVLGFFARLSQHVPDVLRRLGTKGMGFHIDDD